MAEEGLAYPRAHLEPDEAFTYKQAVQVLQAHDIKQLLAGDLVENIVAPGYLYEIDGNFRITD